MARSVRKLFSGSEMDEVSFPLTQSLLGGIKRLFNFFVITDDELARAGVFLGYSGSEEMKNPGTALDESGESGQVG